jgi:flagellar basal-body rod protein FlgG
MNGAFYIGAIGVDAQQRALDVIANNIANLNTGAFKRSGVQFSELVAPLRDANDIPVTGLDRVVGMSGASLSATPRIWSQGVLKRTGNPLDIAIDGVGFLEVLGPAGKSLLWRGGTLRVNTDGLLATADGLALRSMISTPLSATSPSIAPDGTVSAITDGSEKPEQLGRLDIVVVKDPNALSDAGNGYYELGDEAAAVTARPGEDGSGTFTQGALEGANVQLADEMTSLLLVQRAFAANAQVLQAADQMMSIVNGLRR